jgi:hypothetical protein
MRLTAKDRYPVQNYLYRIIYCELLILAVITEM